MTQLPSSPSTITQQHPISPNVTQTAPSLSLENASTNIPDIVSTTTADDTDDDEQGPLRDTTECIEEALGDLQREGIVALDVSNVERKEEEKVELFMRDGCGCKLNCHQTLGKEAIVARRNDCAELSKQELDLVILGQLGAFEKGSTPQSSRLRSSFYMSGSRVCKRAFLFVHGVGEKQFKNLKRHFSQNGLVPRLHGNSGKAPHNAITLDDAKHAVTFLFEYAEVNALLLPGRVPGYKKTDIQVNIHIISE